MHISEKKYKSLLKKVEYLTWFMQQSVTTEQKERWLKGAFYNLVGYYPDLKHPKTFNEKMCWLRLNYVSEEVNMASDKALFQDYVEEVIGSGYTSKIYNIYKSENDVKIDKLPNKFVLKSSYSSASNNVMLIKDKADIDLDFVKYQMSEWLQPWNSTAKSFSNWYANVQPQIIAEELLESPDGDLKDYKFMCFNGEPKCLFVVSDRFGGKYLNFYDLEWNLLSFTRLFENSPYEISKPKKFNEMLEISRKFAKRFPFVRVDFYEVDGRLLIGELEFSPGGGLEPFEPAIWDYKLGDMLSLEGL